MTFSKRVLLSVLAGLISPVSVFATVMFTEPSQIQIRPNQEFEVSVFLNTDGEDINAIEGKVVYPTDVVTLKEIRDGNSIINFWVERPEVSSSLVRFAGIIPGGYRYPRGLVFSLVFESKGEGSGPISIEEVRTLRNDGEGTNVPATVTFTSVNVSPSAEPTPEVAPIRDGEPPEAFSPVLSQDPEIFEGKWFLSFATQDKGSGIDHYEIRESYFWGKGRWVTGQSPFELKSQDPTRPSFVKAVDRAGNERVVRVEPIQPRNEIYDLVVMLGILLLIAVMCVAIGTRIRSSWRKK
jgi:hypothetical protein